MQDWELIFLDHNMIGIETYEDCPVGKDLLVWTGDSFDVEYIDVNSDDGTYYPANGQHFTHYMELPSKESSIKFLTEED